MPRLKLAFVVGVFAVAACGGESYKVSHTGGNSAGGSAATGGSGGPATVATGGSGGLGSIVTGGSGGAGGNGGAGRVDAMVATGGNNGGAGGGGGGIPLTGGVTVQGGRTGGAGSGGMPLGTGGRGGSGGVMVGTGGAGGTGDAGPSACSCEVAGSDAAQVHSLTLGWACYCQAYRCDLSLSDYQTDGGGSTTVLSITEYADCALVVVSTKMGGDLPLSHVFDLATGRLVGEQRGTDVPSKCPFDDASSYWNLSAGQFPAPTCKATKCTLGGSPIATCGSGGSGGSATGGSSGMGGAGGTSGTPEAGTSPDPYTWIAVQDTEQKACTTVGPGADIDAVALVSQTGAMLGYGKIGTAVFTVNPMGNACENVDCSGGNCKYAAISKTFLGETLVGYTEGPPDGLVQAVGDDAGYLSLNAGTLQIQVGDVTGTGPAKPLQSGDYIQVFEVDKTYIASGSAPATCSCLPEHFTVFLQTASGSLLSLAPVVIDQAWNTTCTALTALSTEGCGTTMFQVP